jgi:uncharacterized protein (TIGR03792 family)
VVVEFLTFTVPPAELTEWLEIEERHWSRFLERQDGFVRKEMWRGEGDKVHAVIWWESMEQWQSIPAAALDEVVAAMGPAERTATCVAYEVLRES